MKVLTENWKPVEKLNGYEVSDCGRVRSVDRMVDCRGDKQRLVKGRILSYVHNDNGYRYVSMSYKQLAIARLVALAFIPNLTPLITKEVNHISGNIDDNNVSNLEWCTSSGNTRHAIESGLVSTLVAVEQFDLDGTFIADFPSQGAASRATGVSGGNISSCIRGVTRSAGGYRWVKLRTTGLNSIGEPISNNHYYD